jgi:CheY-like chemotaxis protein
VLQRNGYDSRVVADGESALTRARDTRPSMIFADLTIKGMGGEQLCSVLKASPETKNIPYVVVSGDRDIAEKARVCGADDFMGKPFEFDDLIRLVNKYARAESRKAD